MSELFQQLSNWWAILDILILTALIYKLSLLIRGTKAMQIVFGIMIIMGAAFLLSQVYPLTALKWFMDKFYSSIIIILVILFQDEIRRVLSRMGKKGLRVSGEFLSSRQIFDELVRAAFYMSSKKIGALIAVERSILISPYIDIGVAIDGRISQELIVSVFHPSSPIHDGAVIIQQGRIAAAGCFLPLTRDDVDSTFGTRHRAAIGISQETDAVVIAVSEERGAVSLVVDGQISRPLEAKELRKALRVLLSHSKDPLTSVGDIRENEVETMKIFNKGEV